MIIRARLDTRDAQIAADRTLGSEPFLSRWRPGAQRTWLREHHARFGGRPPVPMPRLWLRTWARGESVLRLKIGTRDAAGVDMHPGQLAISLETVRELVDAQFPWWRALAIKPVDSAGTVNAIFRVGDQLAARLPLEPGDPGVARRHLESEARAARELAGRTRFPTPEPVALGEPGAGYPLPWLVQTWLRGVTATEQDPGGSAAFAHDLAEFVSGVRAISTDGRTFSGSGRGGDLASHDSWMQTCFARIGRLVDVPRLRRMWDVLRELPRGAGGDVVSHGPGAGQQRSCS